MTRLRKFQLFKRVPQTFKQICQGVPELYSDKQTDITTFYI